MQVASPSILANTWTCGTYPAYPAYVILGIVCIEYLQRTTMSEFYNRVCKPIFENGSLFEEATVSTGATGAIGLSAATLAMHPLSTYHPHTTHSPHPLQKVQAPMPLPKASHFTVYSWVAQVYTTPIGTAISIRPDLFLPHLHWCHLPLGLYIT